MTQPTTTDPAATSFATRIRDATAASHRAAEHAPFLAGLVGGSLPIEGYGRLVVQHRAIYDALEGGNALVAADAIANRFIDPDIARLQALEGDVVAVLGPDWPRRPEAELVPATIEYCARLTEVAAIWPGGWVGHQYVRYLGDLSGGRFIRRAIEVNYGIDETCGTAFYDFPAVPDPAAWKDAYRARLDAAAWTDDERDRIIDEILAAYDWNTRLLQELS